MKVIGGALLLIGLATQAHAGNYVLQTNGWNLSASAKAVTATPSNPDYGDGYKPKSFTWEWHEDNATDTPKPAIASMDFNTSVGACSVTAYIGETAAWSAVFGGFKNAQGINGATFSDETSAFANQPNSSAAGGSRTVSMPIAAGQNVTADMEVGAATYT